jgi:hypothetical protein
MEVERYGAQVITMAMTVNNIWLERLDDLFFIAQAVVQSLHQNSIFSIPKEWKLEQ